MTNYASSYQKRSNQKNRKYKEAEGSTENSNIVLLVQAHGMKFITYMNGVPVDGFGPDIVLLLKRSNQGAGGALLNLTDYNVDELVAIKEVIDRTFDLSMEIAKARDEKAGEIAKHEHMPLDRLTRPIPRVVVSKRLVGVDVQELLQRPADILDDDADDEPK